MFLLTALELAQGRLKKDTLLAHARTGFCDLREEQADALENYAYCKMCIRDRDYVSPLLEIHTVAGIEHLIITPLI